MKITYIANIRFPTEKAHGVQIMSVTEAFANLGIDVELLVSDRESLIKDDPFNFYGIETKFPIKKIKTIDLTHYGHILRSSAYHLERVTFVRGALKYAWANKENVFYTRDELTFLVFSLFNIKIFYEMHTMPRKIFIYKQALKKSSKIVSITNGLKEKLAMSGIEKDKIIVAPDGVNLKKFLVSNKRHEARLRIGLKDDDFVVMYIGLLDEWKGYKTLLEASKLLKNEGVKVVLVGGSEKQIEGLKKRYKGVIFTPFIPYSELPIIQQAGDILAIPNSKKYDISRVYTSPLKLFAHMASGIPIISSDLPSLREILTEDTTEFFKPDDPISLSNKIIELKKSKEKRTYLYENALKEVRKYSWENRAKIILDAIK